MRIAKLSLQSVTGLTVSNNPLLDSFVIEEAGGWSPSNYQAGAINSYMEKVIFSSNNSLSFLFDLPSLSTLSVGARGLQEARTLSLESRGGDYLIKRPSCVEDCLFRNVVLSAN